SIVVGGRGKLGGQVATASNTGAVLRNNVIPTRSATKKQQEQRSQFTYLSQRWGQLTEEQRQAWLNARDIWQQRNIFGDDRRLSGKALFQKLNGNLLSAGGAVMTSPPRPLVGMQTTSISPVIDLTAQTITAHIDSFDGDNFFKWRVLLTRTLTPGTTSAERFLVLNHIGGQRLNNNPVVTWSQYVKDFRTPAVGDNIWLGMQAVLTNGQQDPLLFAKCRITP